MWIRYYFNRNVFNYFEITESAIRFVELGHILAYDASFRPSIITVYKVSVLLRLQDDTLQDLRDLGFEHNVELRSNRHTGFILYLNRDAGTGKIRSDGNAADYFFYFKQLDVYNYWADLKLGTAVSFVSTANKQGLLAMHIDIIDC